MGDARTGTGHLAWVTWGLAALGAHLLLLWSVPNAPVETVLAAATTVTWEVETWEALAAIAPAAEPIAEPAAIAAPASPAPRTHTREPTRVAKAQQHKARAVAVAKPSADEDAQRTALEARGDEDAQLAAAVQGDASHAATETLGETANVTGTREQGAASSGAGTGANGQAAGALMRGPRLLATHDPCAGFFPGTAEAKRGQVQLSIDVDADGRPHPTQTLLELPRGQGFETAAKACAAHLHFAPALDAQGHPVSAQARIALRFERS